MSVNTSLIYGCLSSASTVIRWLRGLFTNYKSPLYTFYSRNPTCGIHPCLWISNRKYPPCPQNSIIMNPPSPSEILKAVCGMIWIFSGIAQCKTCHGQTWSNLGWLGLTGVTSVDRDWKALTGQQKLMHAARCWKKVTGADKYMYWKS